jgi:hypothetical protein
VHDADAGLERRARIAEPDFGSIEEQPPRVRRVNASEDASESALASTVLTAKRVTASGGDVDGDVVQATVPGKRLVMWSNLTCIADSLPTLLLGPTSNALWLLHFNSRPETSTKLRAAGLVWLAYCKPDSCLLIPGTRHEQSCPKNNYPRRNRAFLSLCPVDAQWQSKAGQEPRSHHAG